MSRGYFKKPLHYLIFMTAEFLTINESLIKSFIVFIFVEQVDQLARNQGNYQKANTLLNKNYFFRNGKTFHFYLHYKCLEKRERLIMDISDLILKKARHYEMSMHGFGWKTREDRVQSIDMVMVAS